MDINEVTSAKINRHPWELSRTSCLLKEWLPYLKQMPENSLFINLGAGDMFFDKHLLRIFKNHRLNAVDIGYATEKINFVRQSSKRIHMFDCMEKTREKADYALMMDSLEYMPDPVKTLRDLTKMVKPGGYVFFTLPAYQWLFSEHDEIVRNLRRYNIKDMKKVINQVEELSITEFRYFYFSLFLVRIFQKYSHMKIDPEHKVTAGWRYAHNHPLTQIVTSILNFDYFAGGVLSHIGIKMPGLSLMIVCRRK